MCDNSFDRTIERNYIQKRRFLIAEYEEMKAKKRRRDPGSQANGLRRRLPRQGDLARECWADRRAQRGPDAQPFFATAAGPG